MSTAKAAALALIEKLPDDATWEKIAYAVRLRMKLEQAAADSAAGRVYSNEQVMKEMDEWLASPGPSGPTPTSAGP
jgi:hypothetical protein